jgi:hypothetical protein
MNHTVESVLCDARVRSLVAWSAINMTSRYHWLDDGTIVHIHPRGLRHVDIQIQPRVKLDFINLDLSFEAPKDAN